MSYAENRIIHDADSHLMELADCLDPYLDAKSRARYDELPKLKAWPRDSDWVNKSRATQADPVFRAGETANILLRKDYEALGAFIREDRPARSTFWASRANSSSRPGALAISASTRARISTSPMPVPMRTTA